MRLRTIPLGSPRGCELRLDPGLVLGLGYLAWMLTDRYAVLGQLSRLGVSLAAGPMFWASAVVAGVLAAVLLHDIAQLVVLRLLGGRVTSMTFTLLGGRISVAPPPGVTASSLEWRASLLGPLVVILLGMISLLAAQEQTGRADAAMALGDLGHFLVMGGAISLLPAFPLPGGRILRALAAPHLGIVRATRLSSLIGKGLAGACVGLAIYQRNIPLLFVAVFLYGGASAEERNDAVDLSLSIVNASEAMMPILTTVSVHDRIGRVASELGLTGASVLPVLATDGAPVAAIGIADLRRVPARHVWSLTVADLLPTLGGIVAGRTPLSDVRRQMNRRKVSSVTVLDESGALAGVLSLAGIERRLDLLTRRRRAPVAAPAEQSVPPL
jgi:Zn-dependent protease/CBS domain-containing protein